MNVRPSTRSNRIKLLDFLNGFYDTADSIATVISTRVLSPRYAVIWAAFFNFIASLFSGLHVAGTIRKGIIDICIMDKGSGHFLHRRPIRHRLLYCHVER